ncbi:MAG: U32 family peptidase [Acholeplasmataceae bacterium]|nr:U32 family peptidase [Acholeplasmataceae bacterium]
MRLLTTLYDLNQMTALSSFVDGFCFGNDKFGTRLTKSFSIEEIIQAIQISKSLNKATFLYANQMFTDDQLIQFEFFLKQLPISDLTGIVVADIGGYRTVANLGYSQKVVYNPETLLTNFYDFNFLEKFGIQGAYIAKEITLEDLLVIAKQKKYKLFMVGHGHLNMFYSKRQLIDNFTQFNGQDHSYNQRQDLRIIEENRQDQSYPILEDQAGTHVFRSEVFSSLNDLDMLETWVDFLVVDTIFKNDEYAQKVLPLYRKKNIDQNVIADVQNQYKETWDEGFFHKKTIYMTKDKS